MAATSSSSKSASNSLLPKKEPKQEPILPIQEPKQEIKQDIKQEPQHVLFFSKDLPSEIIDTKEVKREPIEDPFDEMDCDQQFEKQQLEKFKRYEADMKQYLIDKYFSDKDVFGGNIFDVKVQVDGKSTMASRFAPYQSYADPKAFQELLAKESTSVETKPDVGESSGKP